MTEQSSTQLINELREEEMKQKEKTQAKLIGQLIGIFIVNPLIGGTLLSIVLPYSFWDCYILALAVISLIASGINASILSDKE